jgi:DsbC/DsbD-like thiol-disulfide interchange protein
MRTTILTFCLLLAAMLVANQATAQRQNPVKWNMTVQHLGNQEAKLILTGTIEEGWNTYSQTLESDMGPIPTTITWQPGVHFALIGKAEESGGRFTTQDPVFDMKLTKFKHTAIFTQKVKINDPTEPIKGSIEYMVCNDEVCLPPVTINFEFKVNQ